jgi:hypothetical protein
MSTSASMSTLHSADKRYSAFSGTPACAGAFGATATMTTLKTQSRRSARPIQIEGRSRMFASGALIYVRLAKRCFAIPARRIPASRLKVITARIAAATPPQAVVNSDVARAVKLVEPPASASA